MKPAVIYLINFFHVAVIKLRCERCGASCAKRGLSRLSLSPFSLFLISLYFFPRLSGIHGVAKVASRQPRRTPAFDKLTNFRRRNDENRGKAPVGFSHLDYIASAM